MADLRKRASIFDTDYVLVKAKNRNNPSITQKQLENITGLSRSGVRYILRKLQEENVLHRVGATKNGQWIFTGNN